MTITVIPPRGPVGADGLLLHDGDHVAQLALALENLELALADAGLVPADLVELIVCTTDLRLLADAYEVLTDRLDEHGVHPVITTAEVSRLDQPGALVSVGARVGRPSQSRTALERLWSTSPDSRDRPAARPSPRDHHPRDHHPGESS